MIFNFWRRYPRRKPKEDGFYLCTIPMGTTDGYVRKLMYSTRTDKWTDIYRQKVFDGYVVYKVCRAPIDENRVRTDGMCDRRILCICDTDRNAGKYHGGGSRRI